MRNQDRVDRGGIDPALLQPREGRRTAIDQDPVAACLQQEAGFQPAAAAKRITAGEKGDRYGGHAGQGSVPYALYSGPNDS